MDNANDSSSPRQPEGAGTGASGGGEPRKPRIEVLRSAPAAEPQPGAGVVGGGGGSFRTTAHAEPYVVPPPEAVHQPRQAPETPRRRSGGLLRSPAVLVALAALAVLIAALWYTSAQRGPDVVFDVGDEGTGPAATEMTPLARGEEEAAPEPVLREAPPTAEPAPAETAPEAIDSPDSGAEAAAGSADPEAAEDSAPAGSAGALAAVRAFYNALSAGDGASAAQLVVPGKRRSGPLSAGSMSRYYSSFRRPLRVRSIAPVDADTVRVAYDYVLADGRLCRGSASVEVVQSGDRSLVSGIRTRGPC